MLSAIFGLLKRLARAYNATLLKYPLRTSMISGMGLHGLGDYFSQMVLERKFLSDDPLWFIPDIKRSAKMIAIGALWSGPVGLTYFWFINPWYLKHVVPRLFPRWTKNFSKWK